MNRLLLCAGVNGDRRALNRLLWVVQACAPDGVLFAGGILARSRRFTPHATTFWGMPSEDAIFIEDFFKTLGKLKLFTALIPGMLDTPLEEFLRIGMHAEIDFPNIHVAHATLVHERDLAVCGVGGLVSADGGQEPHSIPRVLVKYHLRSLWTAKQPRRVLLLPTPTPGRLGGAPEGAFIGELIDSYHPTLCVTGAASARHGYERVGSTLVVNPGTLASGWAAWLNWRHEAGRQVTFLDLSADESPVV